MSLIRRYIFESIINKKGRTILILFAIIISTASFFASASLSESIKSTYYTMIRNSVGSSDIIVKSGEKEANKLNLFKTKSTDAYKDKVEYSINELNLIGIYNHEKNEEKIPVSLHAFNYDELVLFNKQVLYDDVQDLRDNQIIMSKSVADKYGFKKGDTFKFTVNKTDVEYTIVALAHDSGLYSNEVGSITAIVSLESLQNSIHNKDLVSNIYIKVKNGVQVSEVKDQLKSIYANEKVQDSIDENDVKPLIAMISSSFSMIMMLVFIMSVFIIYSVFKVIMKERLSVIGTFRSVGATQKQIISEFFKESLMYGIIGGLLGNLLGVGILYLIAFLTNPYKDVGVNAQVNMSVKGLIISFFVAIVLTLLSAMVPIIKTSRTPIKNIILSIESEEKINSLGKNIFAIISILLCLFIVDKLPKSLAWTAGCTIVLCTIIGFIFLIPLIVNIFIKVLSKVFPTIFGNESLIALNNIKDNKTLINNISILVIGIASVIIISLSIFSAENQIASNYSHFNYDVVVKSNENNVKFLDEIKKMAAVKDAYGIYRVEKIKEKSTGKFVVRLEGASDKKFLNYVDIDASEEDINILKDGNGILLGDVQSYTLGLKVGDKITLEMPSGDTEYTVKGIFNTNYIRSGLYALISDDNFLKDANKNTYEEIWIKTDDVDGVIKEIKNKFPEKNPMVLSKSKVEEAALKFNQQIDKPMAAFAVLAFLIGLFGILNNFIMSFIERKRSIAIYRSIGLSQSQIKKMTLIESLTIGLIGSTIAITLSLVILPTIPVLTKAMGSPLLLTYSSTIFIMYFVFGILITIIASLICVRKTKELNIIQAIKYE